MIDCLGSEEREVLRNYWNVKGAFVIQYEPIKQTLALPALCKEEVDPQVRRTRGCEGVFVSAPLRLGPPRAAHRAGRRRRESWEATRGSRSYASRVVVRRRVESALEEAEEEEKEAERASGEREARLFVLGLWTVA